MRSRCTRQIVIAAFCAISLLVCALAAPEEVYQPVERLARFEAYFQATGTYQNPYREVEATAVFERPGRSHWEIPLFWDGESR